MTKGSEKNFLIAQIKALEELLKNSPRDPFMDLHLQSKIDELKADLSSNEHVNTPSVVMLFSGNAVEGSIGIKAKFISEIIKSFTDYVSILASSVSKTVNDVGRMFKIENNDMYLTNLSRGSFGIELANIGNDDWEMRKDLSLVLDKSIDIILSATESDNLFADSIRDYPDRAIPHLESFLNKLEKNNSHLDISSGNKSLSFTRDQIKIAFDRVHKNATNAHEVSYHCILTGLFLESKKFEAKIIGVGSITGKISPDLSVNVIEDFDHKYFNKKCIIHFLKTTTKSATKTKEIFELVNITDLANK